MYFRDAPRGAVVVPPRDVPPLGVLQKTGVDMVKRTASEATLRAVVARYTRHNDRFERLLNERDKQQRQHTRERLLARGAPGRFALAFGERVVRAFAPFRELGTVRR